MSRNMRILLICEAIVVGAVIVAVVLDKTKPRAKRRPPPVMVPLVECQPLVEQRYAARIVAMGTVMPAVQLELKARVSGEVVAVHKNWFPGGEFSRGDELMRLDAADYRIALAQADASVAQAESDLMLEEGRQDVARREWSLLGPDSGGTEQDRTLALRKPQLTAAKARVAAAQAQRDRAALDLERTRIVAPFDGIVLSRSAQPGDQVTSQTPAAQVASLDRCHVQVAVPASRLAWIKRPRGDDAAVSAAEVEWPDGTARAGRIIALLGDLAANGSMARLLVEVSLKRGERALFGSYAKVTLTGSELPAGYRVPREALVDGTVLPLVTVSRTLHIVPVKVIWDERDTLICTGDIPDGARLVSSQLSAPVEGMDLRVAGDPLPGKETSATGEGNSPAGHRNRGGKQ